MRVRIPESPGNYGRLYTAIGLAGNLAFLAGSALFMAIGAFGHLLVELGGGDR